MSEKTRIPTDVDTEDPFLPLGVIQLSLRQLLTIMLAATIWMLCLQVTLFILPVSSVFAGVIWSWIIFAGFFLALVKKDGRPYEEYLSHRVVFLLSNKTFIQKDPNAKYGSVEDANWDELDDEDVPPSF
jgi:hypothetical protein